MAEQILMPKLGLTMKTGTVVKWFKDEGDPVAEKEPVLEIETEKLSSQIESPVAGVLIKKLAAVGEKYPVSCVLGYVGSPGERIETTAAAAAASAVDIPVEIEEKPVETAVIHAPGPDVRVFISPVAKKLASSLDIDYRKIKGTGPNGRIIKADVQKFAERPMSAAPVYQAVNKEDTIIPYTGMRRAIGENMLNAWTTIPMVTHHVMADVTELVEYRARLNRGVTDRSEKVSVNDLILKLTATALADMPIINSSLTDKGIVLYSRVHLGVATSIENGLVVPVIRDANLKSLLTISKEAKDLAERARNGTLGFDETAGGTFTVTNLGGYGSVDLFTPIINPPQAAILGVGRITETAMPVNSEITIRSMMGLSFTYDHRIIDGAMAAEFIKKIMQLLENPFRSALYCGVF
jgi:pyruvate dehydrogenase E2 component (dihydrolipoamide acetyltransferase)